MNQSDIENIKRDILSIEERLELLVLFRYDPVLYKNDTFALALLCELKRDIANADLINDKIRESNVIKLSDIENYYNILVNIKLRLERNIKYIESGEREQLKYWLAAQRRGMF